LVHDGGSLIEIARFEKASAIESEIAAHESNIEEDRLFEIESVSSTEI